MEINSKNGIIKIIDEIQEKSNKTELLKEKLQAASKESWKRILFLVFREIKKCKLQKKEMRGQIKADNQTIEKLSQKLNSIATFDFEAIASFLSDTVSIIEQKRYLRTTFELAYTHVELNPSLSIVLDTQIPVPVTDYENICLITTPKNTKIICEKFDSGQITRRYDITEILKNGDYILLDSKRVYTVFNYNNWEVPEELTANFPYLGEIIPDLMNLKSENENLSDAEVTSLIVSQIPQRYPHLITNYAKRKQE